LSELLEKQKGVPFYKTTCTNCFMIIFLRAFLSVCPSVTRVDQSKTVQAKITKFLPSDAWKTLVSRTVKLFHKFERSHPERRR